MNGSAQHCTKEKLFDPKCRKLDDICQKFLVKAAQTIERELRNNNFLDPQHIEILQDFGLDADLALGPLPEHQNDGRPFRCPHLSESIAIHLHSVLFEIREKMPDARLSKDVVVEIYMNKLRDFARAKGSGKNVWRYYWKRFSEVLRIESKRQGSGLTITSHAPKDNPCRNAEHSGGRAGAYTFSFEGTNLPVFSPSHLRQHRERLMKCHRNISMCNLQSGEEGPAKETIVNLCRDFFFSVRDSLGAPHAICLSACLDFLRDIYPAFSDVQTESEFKRGDDEDYETLVDALTYHDFDPCFLSAEVLDAKDFTSEQIMGVYLEVQDLVGGWSDEECRVFNETQKGRPSLEKEKMKERLLKDVQEAFERHPLADPQATRKPLVAIYVHLAEEICKLRF